MQYPVGWSVSKVITVQQKGLYLHTHTLDLKKCYQVAMRLTSGLSRGILEEGKAVRFLWHFGQSFEMN